MSTSGVWEVVPAIGNESDGINNGVCIGHKVRWSVPNKKGEYLWVGHYYAGIDGVGKFNQNPSLLWCGVAADSHCKRMNDEGKLPFDFGFTVGIDPSRELKEKEVDMRASIPKAEKRAALNMDFCPHCNCSFEGFMAHHRVQHMKRCEQRNDNSVLTPAEKDEAEGELALAAIRESEVLGEEFVKQYIPDAALLNWVAGGWSVDSVTKGGLSRIWPTEKEAWDEVVERLTVDKWALWRSKLGITLVDQSQSKPIESEKQVKYEYQIFNRADGVLGHYSIGRSRDDSPYIEFWNADMMKWSTEGTVYYGRDITDAYIRTLQREGADFVDLMAAVSSVESHYKDALLTVQCQKNSYTSDDDYWIEARWPTEGSVPQKLSNMSVSIVDAWKEARKQLVVEINEKCIKTGSSFYANAFGIKDMEQVEYGGGKVLSTKIPPYHLIPTLGLRRLAERFALGIERKGDKAWNALSNNQEVLTDREFLIERLGHVIDHAVKLRDKVAQSGPLVIGDDDAGAIAWSGIFAICATDAIVRKESGNEV